jgi:hypothetical protein
MNQRPYILGIGQSNMENWFGYDFGCVARDVFNTVMGFGNSSERSIIVNGANDGSFMSKKASQAGINRSGSGITDVNDFWVDNTTTPFTAGPRLTDAMTAITTYGASAADMLYSILSQGEADAGEIYATLAGTSNPSYTTNIDDYWDALVWLKDYLFTNLPNLQQLFIVPIGRYTSTSSRYNLIRQKQILLAATYPSQVTLCPDVYDLPSTDGRHRSPAGYFIEGQRIAYSVLKEMGRWDGNAVGPSISAAEYDTATNKIILTVAHDKGTSLKNGAGVVYDGSGPVNCTPTGTGIFAFFDNDKTVVAISSVEITDYDQITITPAQNSFGFLQIGYLQFTGLDLNSCILDNDPVNPLPLRCTYDVVCAPANIDAYLDSLGATVWADPQLTANLTYDGSDLVSNMTLRRGTGSFVQATAAQQPKRLPTGMGGKQCLQGYHAGVASAMTLADAPDQTWSNLTVFVVAARDADSGLDEHIVSKYPSGSGYEFIVSVDTTDKIVSTFATSNTTAVTNRPSYVPTLGNTFIHTLSYDGATVRTKTQDVNNQSGSSFASATYNNSTQPMQLFSRTNGITLPFQGRIGDVMLVPSYITAINRNNAELAFKKRWGVV